VGGGGGWGWWVVGGFGGGFGGGLGGWGVCGGCVGGVFVKSCEAINYKCISSDDNTNIYKHIDFFIIRPDGTKTTVDVKGGNHLNVIWVEFKNVRGDIGWLYGDAELIAFDMPEMICFLILKRIELLKKSESIVEKVFVGKLEANKKLYQRNGRQDVISRLEFSDIEDIVIYKLKYA